MIGELVDLGPEENFRRLQGCGQSFVAMHQAGEVGSQPLSARPAAGVGSVLILQLLDLRSRQIGEVSQTLADVGVLRIVPILIELIRAGFLGREPEGPGLGLAHFRAVGLRQQRASDAMELYAADPPGEIDSRRDVAPLVAAAGLQFAAVMFVKVDEIVGLEQHVAELGIAQAGIGPLAASP